MTATATPRHRLAVAVARIRAELDATADAPVWSMDEAETARTLIDLAHAAAQLAEVTARVAAHADRIDVGRSVGASSTAIWLAHTTKQTRPEATRTVKLGLDLETHAQTREALARGDVCVEQARTIIRWVDQLPAEIDAPSRARAEAHLLEQAGHHDARALNRMGRRLFEVVAPDEADAREAAILAAEERAAWAKTYFQGFDDGHGMGHGRFGMPIAEFAYLTKLVHATMARRHRAALEGTGAEPRPTPEALGRAFCELVRRYPATKLPKTGGLNATLLVIIDEESLMGRAERAGVLDTGERVSPGKARQLLCEAAVIPVVLGGDSEPLDVGRRRRLHTDHQRYAMLARDRGCRAEGCDRTTGLHSHHKTPWSLGGGTSVRDGVTLCPWHHAKAHDTGYRTTYQPNGDVTFHRRT